MATVTKRPPLELSDKQREFLETKSQSRKSPLREVQRAKILLNYADRKEITKISKIVNVSRPTIYKCIDKALAAGVENGLKDKYHRPKAPTITDEAKLWVINLACTKPKEIGYAAETWTVSKLAEHTRRYAPLEGHNCLSRAAKATIHRILNAHAVQPHKISYYLERRDPRFKEKMAEVLMVYEEVNIQSKKGINKDALSVVTVSVDEKPGIQAIKNIAPDLSPVPGKHPTVGRDYEYKRLGTVSLLAALDLQDGYVIGQVHRRHRSKEFISLLKELDDFYPAHQTIRIILDNHSSHISKETMKYLESRPNRFEYVHTPTHGSWLNIVETLFGKMARTFLKHIRVNSIEELKERILKGIKEINAAPVVHRWNKFDIEFSN